MERSSTLARAFRALAAALLSFTAHAAEIYVDADAPPGGDGSREAPLRYLAEVAPLVRSDDVVYLKGVFRGESLAIFGYSHITITRWPGETVNPVLRGDVPIPPEAWRFDEASGAWYAPVGERVVSFLANWDTNIDEHGRHYGFHRRFGSESGIPPGYFFDSGAGVVWMNPPENAADPDPRKGLDQYSYIRRGNAIRVGPSGGPLISRIRVAHIDFMLWGYWDEILSGYGVRIEGSTDSVIEDCNFYDTGKHAAGFVGSGSIRNTMRRIYSAGLDANADPSAGHLVFFSLAADVTDSVGEDCELHCYTSLDTLGQHIRGAANGVFSHSFPPARVLSVVWRRIRCVEYNDNFESAFGLGPSTPLPADRQSTNPDDYAVRFIECTLENGGRMFFADGAGPQAAAFERCRLHFTRTPSSGSAFVIRIQGTNPSLLMERCEIVANGGITITSDPRIFDVPASSALTLVGCLVHVSGPVENNCAHIRQNIAFNVPSFPNSPVLAIQTLFSREEQGCFHRGNNTMIEEYLPNSLMLRDCWYWNINPQQVSIGAWRIGLLSEFRRIIDANGVYNVDPEFTDPAAGDYEGAERSNLRSMTRDVPGLGSPMGINRRPASGHWGPHQYGLAADLSADGIVNAADLAAMLGAWGPCAATNPCPADLNGDGLVNAADLAILLGAWTPTGP